MTDGIDLKRLLIVAGLVLGLLGLIGVATADGWGIPSQVKTERQIYRPGVRNHGYHRNYLPTRRYRGFYDGGPGVPK